MTNPDHAAVLAHARPDQRRSYDTDKLQLYGVGVGLGLDPLDTDQLARQGCCDSIETG